jgi:hypothetical protein
MQRLTVLFSIAAALGAIILVPVAAAKEPTPLKACQTISQPGSYELVDNLTAGGGKDCLVITASFVTIDLAGFSISASPGTVGGAAIFFGSQIGGQGIAVRNGSISGFSTGVDLGSALGSIVEGLRIVVFTPGPGGGPGISATGIVKGNTVANSRDIGISATGTVTGNYVSNSIVGISIGQGSTVIGNTVVESLIAGLSALCPSNLIDNTAVSHNGTNLVLNGEGCHNEDNLAP